MSIVDGLNEEQRLPVLDTAGAILVTAGAGSGKTRLLTHRIAYLILEKGISPYNILAITFTNKAAREMRERVCRMVTNGEYIWVSTFHSLCVTILRREIDKLDGYNSKFSIYSDTEKNRVLKDIYLDLNITDDGEKKSAEYHMSNIKNQNTTLDDYINKMVGYVDEDVLRRVYNKYTLALRNSNALDFDDLLVKTYELFSKHPDVLAKYQDRFRYIHVDEFQDTNTVQYDIVSLLAKKWGNILVVGDEDQCIYGWRGANIDNIMNFRRDFPNAHTYKLEQNYRSTKKILEKANMVISNNSQRLEKLLWTQNTEGTDVVYYAGDSDRQEAEFVIRTIINLVRNKGYKFSDCAILMRYSAPSRLFEEYMMQYNVPYKMLGGFKFFERVEIKNIIAYLRAVVNPLDNESVSRIINVPKRGIGESTINELRNQANGGSYLSVLTNLNSYYFTTSVTKKLQSFTDVYNQISIMRDKLSLTEYVKYVIDIVGLKAQYDPHNEEDFNKIQNIDQFLVSVKDYEKANPQSTLEDYLESITLISDIDTVDDNNNNVLLSTVHAVKGLEFKCVFVIALEEGVFPIVRTGERPSDIEEERRLAYVAITRAKELLYLTRSKRRFLYNQVKYQGMSRFLREMGYEDETSYKSSHFASQNQEYPTKNYINPNKPTPSIQTLLNQKLAKQSKDYSSFCRGTKVFHPKFGAGTIIDDSKLNSNRTVVIDFGALGIKTLSLDYAPLQLLK